MSMRTKVLSGFAAATMFLAPAAFAGTIEGSAHDFSGTFGGGEICKACHAPHNNLAATGLLWNHTESAETYTPYSNTTTMSSAPGQPGATSKLCLSCHDGTIALDSYGGFTGTPVGDMTAAGYPAADFGTDLANDHPIGFTYPTTALDPEIKDSATATVTVGDAPGKTGTIAALMLDGGKVECLSCHDVHNTNAVTTTKLLLVTNTDSDLCLSCHSK